MRLVPSLALVALLGAPLAAADRTWTGGDPSAGLWSRPLNWSGGVPGTADRAVLPGATDQYSYFDSARTVAGVRADGEHSVHRLDTDPEVALTLGGWADGGQTVGLEVNAGVLRFEKRIRLIPASAQTWRVPGELYVRGPVETGPGVTLSLGGAQPGTATLSGPVSGGGGLAAVGIGTLRLGGLEHNTWTGPTSFAGVTVQLSGFHRVSVPADVHLSGGATMVTAWYGEQIADTATVTADAGTTVELKKVTETIAGLAGGGTLVLAPESHLVIAGAADTGFAGRIDGAGRITKQGAGTWTLAPNPMPPPTGALDIAGGRVVHRRDWTGGAAVTVKNGGTLSGDGDLGTLQVDAGGVLDPGTVATPAALGAAALTLAPGSTLRLRRTGAVARVEAGAAIVGGATLELAPTSLPAVGGAWTIIQMAGNAVKVGGVFAGLGEGMNFEQAGAWWTITYQGGDGNDVVVKRLAGPQPTALTTLQVVLHGREPGATAVSIDGATATLQPDGAWSLPVGVPTAGGEVDITLTITTPAGVRVRHFTITVGAPATVG